MRFIAEYFRWFVFGVGVLAGIQLPGFVEQYGKALQSHLLEAQLSFEQFKKTSNQFFGGDVDKLIKHYQNSDDEVFQQGAESLKQMQQRIRQLQNAIALFYQNDYSPYLQTFLYPIPDVWQATFDAYTYTVVLNRIAIFVGLGLGLCFALFVQILLGLLSRLLGFRHRKEATTS